MEYKWRYASSIIVAFISGVATSYGVFSTSENAIILEKLKIQAAREEARRDLNAKRCEEISDIYGEMTLAMQTLYLEGYSTDINPAIRKLAALRSQSLVAKSYLGGHAMQVYEHAQMEVKKDDAPESSVVPSIMALGEELKLCNAPSGGVHVQ